MEDRTGESGADRIAVERRRQLDVEGFDSERDSKYTRGELAKAAVTYILFNYSWGWNAYKNWWPWLATWWKPDNKDKARNLIKAGALIAAEIDRIQREAAKLVD